MYEIKRWGKKMMDFLFFPFTYLAALWYRFIITKGIGFFSLSDSVFMKVGVLPIIDHYYHPMINPKKYLHKSLREDRNLPGINLNVEVQLALLKQFSYNGELLAIPADNIEKRAGSYYYNNGLFGPGDAEILYSVIRHFKPRRIIEVGSGYSTLASLKAIDTNKKEDTGYSCNFTCIEPYERPWLETLGVNVQRTLVEKSDPAFFASLEENDILFIDSSHIIRPQGDVLFEYLEILPLLKKGVIVHVHDIFTPKDYLDSWVLESHTLWNEQYILEAFLSYNDRFEIICALNYLYYHHTDELMAGCPVLKDDRRIEPRSIWFKKTR